MSVAMRDLPGVDRTLRRNAISRGRVVRLATRRTLCASCVFLQVRDCGDAALTEGLHALVPMDETIGVLAPGSIRRALAPAHTGLDERALVYDDADSAERIGEIREILRLMHLAQGCRLVHGHVFFRKRASRGPPSESGRSRRRLSRG